MRNKLLYLPLLLFCILSIGCSDVELNPADYMNYKSTFIGSDICTTNSNTVINNLKFIFVMDRSGSNKTRYELPDLTPLPGTDIDGSRRFDAILDFLNDYKQNENIYYSMINFNSNVLGNSQDFTNDKAAFQNYVTIQKRDTESIDSLGTSYLDGLGRVKDMIRNDAIKAGEVPPGTEKISSNYIVFFVSDGEPRVKQILQRDSDIFGRIQGISDLEDMELVEGIQINTAYYYTPESFSISARDRMVNMAERGRGNAIEFGGDQNIDFSQFDTSSKVIKFEYKQVWIDNLNTVWEGNVLKEDLDGDGLSDLRELELGTDINNPDTDGNGVSDFVEFKLSEGEKGCFHKDCSTENHLYFVCRNFGKPGAYPDTDKDHLNDCEEQLLGSEPSDADSNDDYIPDRLALTHNIKFAESANSAHLDPDNDYVTNYQELQQDSPLRTDNSTIAGLRPLVYVVKQTSTSPAQDCYSIEFKNLTHLTFEDEIRIYFMENTRAGDEKRLVRSATKRMEGGIVKFTTDELK